MHMQLHMNLSRGIKGKGPRLTSDPQQLLSDLITKPKIIRSRTNTQMEHSIIHNSVVFMATYALSFACFRAAEDTYYAVYIFLWLQLHLLFFFN